MPHLMNFRKGWQGENLAKYLLYQVAFVSQPSNVADDIGSDYFCTLFKTENKDSTEYLLPTNSFAIQIKSGKNINSIDFSNKIGFLNSLEIPYLIGIVDRANLSIALYSGEYLPAFLSATGDYDHLKIEPTSEAISYKANNFYRKSGDQYIIKFPWFLEIKARENNESIQEKRQTLRSKCSKIYQNIIARETKEFVFTERIDDSEFLQAYSGPTSVKYYRNHIAKRLAVAFVNLKAIYNQSKEDFNFEEFQTYKDLLKNLEKLEDYHPPALRAAKRYYDRLNKDLEKE